MAYQTLYRKWRPQNFDEVVGQTHITNTLKNEIISGKTAHAYMFTGTRGTGKTSTAKILSRALNCEAPQGGNPCNQCPTCMGILNESILDVVEMDAASNNGVENIRDIIDQVRYSTASSKYKVYIIDEVHMLSMGAFNALLKTLEEPPSHVVFILATTEIHKVPATILSRCQRFDFKNITAADISGAVARILQAEGITAQSDAVEYIAYLGNGSMRDALSITEQCLAYKPDDLTYSDVTEILGTLDDEFLYNAASHIANADTKQLLILFNDCIAGGKNPDSFIEGLLKAMRDILLYNMAPEICDFTTKKKQLIEKTASLYTQEKLVRCIDMLGGALRDIKLSSNSRVITECTLVRLSAPQYDVDTASLLDRISSLENKLARGNFALTAPERVLADASSEPQQTVQAEPPAEAKVHHPAPAVPANADINAVVTRWDDVKRVLEQNGKLISFVSLYGVVPRGEGDTLILPFDTKEAAAKFNSGSALADVKEAINMIFGLQPQVKCIFEEANNENIPAGNDIFDNLAKISTQFPENFKID